MQHGKNTTIIKLRETSPARIVQKIYCAVLVGYTRFEHAKLFIASNKDLGRGQRIGLFTFSNDLRLKRAI